MNNRKLRKLQKKLPLQLRLNKSKQLRPKDYASYRKTLNKECQIWASTNSQLLVNHLFQTETWIFVRVVTH